MQKKVSIFSLPGRNRIWMKKKSSLRLTPRIFFRAKLSDAAKMSLNPKYIAFNEIYFFQEDIRFCFVAFFGVGGSLILVAFGCIVLVDSVQARNAISLF